MRQRKQKQGLHSLRMRLAGELPPVARQHWRVEEGQHDLGVAEAAACRLMLLQQLSAVEAERALAGQKADIAVFTQVGERALQGARAYEHNGFKIPLGQQVVTRNLRDLTA